MYEKQPMMGKFEELFDEDGEPESDFRYERKKRVGAYVLGRTLGEGSFAKVRLGVHLVSRERVAVKVVNKHSVMKRDYARKNLHREAAMLQRLDHQNIIRLYEVMETDNHYYIVTELADGYDFMGYISERFSLPEKEAQRYMRQIVTAVDHMHMSGVIHRDLKIENLMLDRNMNIKIIDFGLGNAWDGYHLLTTQCGSPAYAAPEIFSKRPYSTAVDIWSIGVNLYAMLTGSLPFTADPPNNLGRLHAAILKGCDPPSNISAECSEVLMSLLETDEHKRIKMTELKEHSWIKGNQGPLDTATLKTKPLSSDIDTVVVSHMVRQLGMDEAQIKDSILNNKVNAFTATYQLLCKRKMKGLDGIPGMPREFLAQRATPKGQMEGELGTLRQGDLPTTSHKGVGQINQRQGTDVDRMLQRQQMAHSNIARVSQSKHRSVPSLRAKIDRPEPPSTIRTKHHPMYTQDHSHAQNNARGANDNVRYSHKENNLDNYKECLSKLRSQRERPNRSILKPEGSAGKAGPIKTTGIYNNVEPPPAPPASSAGSACRETLNDLEMMDNGLAVPHNHMRSNSASTKSVRFNLEPETPNDDTSTVVSFRSQGVPSQMERLVLRRLSADKSRRDNIMNMNKIHYAKNQWEINQEAIESLRKKASPDGSGLFASGTGRMRAMRILKRTDSALQNVPPPPPNSALGRHRPVSNSRFASSANSSSRVKSGQPASNGGKNGKYPNEATAIATTNGLSVSRGRQSELLNGGYDHDDKQYNNYQFKMKKDAASRVLVWDLKVLDPSENAASPEPAQRTGSVMSETNMRKLGTLRSQVMLKPKPPASEVNENIQALKSLYRLPPSKGALPSGRLGALDKKVSATGMEKSGSHTVKVRLRPVRSGAFRSITDAQGIPIKHSDSFVAK